MCVWVFTHTVYLYLYIHGDLEKMGGSSFNAHHSEFYLVQVNSHTDFGGLMQQMDCRTGWTDKGGLHKQQVTSLHNRKCKSASVVFRLTVPLECIQCSADYLAFVTQKSKMKKMANERLRTPAVRYWNPGPHHWALLEPIYPTRDSSSQCPCGWVCFLGEDYSKFAY